MNFQHGTGWTGTYPKTWEKLCNHDWIEAAREAADSLWFAQSPVRVIDFQRALFAIAGLSPSYEEILEFNAPMAREHGAYMPPEADVMEWSPAMGGGHASHEGPARREERPERNSRTRGERRPEQDRSGSGRGKTPPSGHGVPTIDFGDPL